jgi:hypothetical protein
MNRRLLCLFIWLLASCGAVQAAPAHIEAHLPQARMAGAGTYTWFSLKIYHAELWVDAKGYQPALPFALDLRYARSLDGAKIAEASVEQMEALGVGSEAQRATWLGQMKALFPNVKEGDRITGVNLPGEGARFYLDGKLIGNVRDPAFASAFFAIWLDPKTSASGLRKALLKDAGPR